MNKSNSDSNNLAIIGASGTGKTVLAVGLHATSTPEFSVSTPPGAEETRKYIEVRQSALEEGYWPAATNESDNIDLRLRLHANGKQSDIVFREYMGERMEKDPNYIRGVIGTPKAAMILFNPGMPGLQSAESRNKMIGNLKVIVQHLKDNKCAAVALVVTASDRLSSDLANFREEFEQYVSLITNHLGTLQLNWKRFDVTVSGELADQNKPKLAVGENNTTHEPFLWLLDCIHAQKVKGRVRKVTGWVTGITLGALAVWGCLWARSKSNLSDIEDKIAGIEAKLTNAWMRKSESEVNNQLSELQKQSTNTLPAVLIVGSGNRDIAVRLEQRLTDDIDLWGVRSLRLEYDAINVKLGKDPLLLGSEKWAKEFDDRLKVAKPSETNAVTELGKLKENWKASRKGMEKRWQVAKLKNEVEKMVVDLNKAEGDSIPARLKNGFDFLRTISRDYPLVDDYKALYAKLDAARKDALARYCAWTAKWSVEDETPPIAGNALEQKLKSNLLGKISKEEFQSTQNTLLVQLEQARREWQRYHFPKRVQRHVTTLKTAGENPFSALETSLSFLASMGSDFPTIQEGSILKARDSIMLARKEALNAYSDSIATKWDVNGKNPPAFDDQKIHNTILTDTAVTSKEWDTFISDMQNRFASAKRQWDENQKRLVDSFDVEGDIQTVVRNYGEFIDENARNPYLESLHNRMNNRLSAYFKKYINDYYDQFRGNKRIGNEEYKQMRMEHMQQQFNVFRGVCLVIAGKGWSSSPLLNLPVGKFARSCVTQGGLDTYGFDAAFGQRFRITRVEVKFDTSSVDPDCRCLELGCQLTSERWNFNTVTLDILSKQTLFLGQELSRGYFDRGWVSIWTGSLDVYTNPFVFTSLRFSYGDRLTNTFSINKDDSSGWWFDPSADRQSYEFPNSIRLSHGGLGNKDDAGKLSFRITIEGFNDDFISLAKKAGLL